MDARAQRLVIKQTVAPQYYPVSLTEAKDHCRIDIGDEDDLVTRLIKAATAHVEGITHRQLMAATWRLTLDRFPVGILNDPCSPAIEGNDILAPRPNLLSVTHVKYDDVDGVEQTLDSSVYRVQADDAPGRITLAYDEEWPDTRSHAGAVRVTYTAGYASGDEATQRAAVPEPVRQAILLLVGHWYENREATIVGTVSAPIAFAVESLLSLETVQELF